MEPKVFEHELNLGTLKGTLRGGITDITVKELAVGGTTSQIIRNDHDWQITINWELVGTMLDSPFFTIPGNWILKAYLEGWGESANEKDLKGDTVGGIPVMTAKNVVPAGSIGAGNPLETEWHYTETFTIKSAQNPSLGMYRLAVAITYEDDKHNPGPIAGFIEVSDMVQIYKPKP